MWVFAARLPKDYLLIAPRGMYPTSRGGYGWHPRDEQGEAWVDDFRPAIEALLELLTPDRFPKANFSQLRLVGFSQGAALTYTFAFLYPGQVISLAGLAGFMPEGASALARNKPLKEKPVFVAHGTKDDQVPIERGRQAVEILELAGAQVVYCEDEVGHKLSAACFRGLQTFFAKS
jgi:phospholipase/carboxylesterase